MPTAPDKILDEDLEHVVNSLETSWRSHRGMRLFVSGGTGFVGTWLLYGLAAANRALSLGNEAVVLTRDPEAFLRKHPRLAGDRSLTFRRGDVRDFAFPDGAFTHVVHAATPASAALNTASPLEMIDIIVNGMRRVLDFTARAKAPRFLFTSSGAVYGNQPRATEKIAEDFPGAPDCLNPGYAYAEAKRVAELMAVAAAPRGRFSPVIARGFAFVGPYLPFDAHFAIGNFIRDALEGEPIVVKGDGRPVRSYLYASDLSAWLWRLLFDGKSGEAYNVGSEGAISIAELAGLVAEVLGGKVVIERTGAPAHFTRYVPDNKKARALGLGETIGLPEAIRRTASWYRAERSSPSRPALSRRGSHSGS